MKDSTHAVTGITVLVSQEQYQRFAGFGGTCCHHLQGRYMTITSALLLRSIPNGLLCVRVNRQKRMSVETTASDTNRQLHPFIFNGHSPST